MKKALLIIDYVNDFIANTGKAYIGESGRTIAPAIRAAVMRALMEDSQIFVCSDIHYPHDHYNPEAERFSDHCLKGTEGRELYGDVRDAVQYVRNAHPELVTMLGKERYSAFVGTKLELYLRDRRVDTLTLVGVNADTGVLHTAIDAFNRSFKLEIPRNAVTAAGQNEFDYALYHVERILGADTAPIELNEHD